MAVSASLDAIGKCPRRPQTRPTKEVSWELANHAKAYLEAQQYENGYAFLHSLLAAGTSISVPAKPYVGFLAPAAQLALASTLVAYPPTTTQTTSADYHGGSDAALRYLRCVQTTIEGPVYTKIRKAFSFPDERTRRRGPARNGAASVSPDPSGDVERLDGTAANAQSIWQRAEDFWHVVGWAFNCSAVHKRRWERWKPWLEVMLGFLEADWAECMRASRNEPANRESLVQDSLLWQYISSQDPSNRNTRRRIIRAILATATSESPRQYPEVWDNETAEPKPPRADKKPVGTVDFESGDLGDYESEDEDVYMQDVAHKGRSRRLSVPPLEPKHDAVIICTEDAVVALGGMDAIQLRQRFIALLAQAAQELPRQFTNLEDFFDNITEELKPLPTIILSVLISTSRLPSLSQLALNANLLLTLTTPQLPNYTKISPHQSHFETILLSLRSNTQSFVANAKISLILEQMFMYMMDANLLEATDDLRTAMESGMEARQKVWGTGKGKKSNAEEEELGKELMEASSERLLGLLEVLEIAAGKEPRPRKEKSKSLPLFSSFGSSLSSAPESESEDED